MNNGNGNKFSIASLACGIVSFFVLPFIFGVASIILGIIGVSNKEEKTTYAVIGIILGIVGVLWALYSGGNL